MLRTVKLIVLLAISTLFFSWFCSQVTAYYPTYTVRLLVACDEEWASIAQCRYGYSSETLARIILSSAFYHFEEVFDITYRIKMIVTWDSCDEVTQIPDMLDEVIAETGFVSGDVADVLVAFTGQFAYWGEQEAWGQANSTLGTVLVRETYLPGINQQATDNVLQHELSHLYQADGHFIKGRMCVMNGYPYFINSFPYYYDVPIAMVTDYWCSDCRDVMSSYRAVWGYYGGGGGGGGATDPLLTPDSTEGEEQ